MALVHQRAWDAAARHESPWYFPILAAWEHFGETAGFPSPEALSELYAAQASVREDLTVEARRLRFALSPPKKKRQRRGPVDVNTLYEGRIALHGQVPTRADDWHDFFNALSFIAFPAAKWALHARQYQLLAGRIIPGARRLPGARTREQDALALLDEGGIVLAVEPDAMPELDPNDTELSHHAELLCRMGQARPVPFGHALYEHLVEGLPCPLGTLHVVRLDFRRLDRISFVRGVDAALARDLRRPELFALPSPSRGLSLAAIEPTPH